MKPKIALKIAIIYLLIGCLWILFSDIIIQSITSRMNELTLLQTYKGWAFVLVTSLLIYLLVGNEIQKRLNTEEELKQKNQEIEKNLEQIHRVHRKQIKSDSRLRILYQNMQKGFAMLNLDERFIDCNPSFSKMLGYPSDEIKALRLKDITHNQTGNLKDIISSRGFSNVYEDKYVKKNGEIFPVEVQAYLFDNDRSSTWFMLTVEDITERKKSKEQLLQAILRAKESDRLKSSFLANISHEIRTPMNSIIGFTDLLNDAHISDKEKINFIQHIRDNGTKLLSLLDDILSYSHLESGIIKLNQSEACLNTIILDMKSIFEPEAHKKGLEFECTYSLPDKLSIIKTDDEKIRKVLTNLLSNALKFTHSGTIHLGYHKIENEIEFFVKDSGIGIPEKIHDKIFERFRQAEITLDRRYGGTGLGLAITKQLVELMQGRIWVDSLPGVGSTFYFRIPYIPVLPEDDESGSGSGSNGMAKPCILIAEDEEVNFLLLMNYLKQANVEIRRAKDGNQAVELCRNHPEIICVLMDIKMPKLNGLEAMHEIKSIRPSLPVVAQTAFAVNESRAQYLKAGFDEYLTKPIRKHTFIKIMSKYVEFHHSPSDSSSRH